ncbi:MAG: type III pantothenate kinase [Verrucomicrobiota bacterium]
MAWLLVDNSNTRTKFALGDARELLKWRGMLPTASVDARALEQLLTGVEYHAAVVCSVVPAVGEKLAKFLAGDIGKPVHMLNSRSPIGMAIDYPEPEQIGADRLANAAAVAGTYEGPMIVTDFGTAVTFDVISSRPAYCGGVIAPGLGAMTDYLATKTALLPVIELQPPGSAIGKSTVHAMQSGAFHGYRGLVKEIIAALSAELGGPPRVIATGGDAEWISQGMAEIHEVAPTLTLEGLRRVAMRLFA